MSRREVRKEVFVAASPERVWRAIAEADQLEQWFPVEARVDPGVGGSIWLSWGGGTEGQAPIAHWEPGRRLGWTEARGEVTLSVDFFLEPRDNGTVVRLVQSGFGAGPEWDDEFHMVQGGWSYFMEHLKWFLEHHDGQVRQLIVFRDAVPVPRPEALARLIGPKGLSVGDTLSGCEPGARFETETAAGDRLSGTVVSASPGTGQMGVTLAGLKDAILFMEMEPHPDGSRAGFWLSLYGATPAEVEAARSRFRHVYAGAFNL